MACLCSEVYLLRQVREARDKETTADEHRHTCISMSILRRALRCH